MSEDAGGVEFILEVNAKIDDALRMTRELTKIQAAAIMAGKGLGEAEKKVGFMTRAMRSAGESIGSFARETMAHFTALAAFEGFKRLGEGTFDMGKEALQAAGEAERLRGSFQLLMGVKPADDLLEYLDNLARHSQFTDGELKGMAGQLIKAGFAGEGLKKGLAAARDAAAFPGDAAANAGDALNILSKIMLKGEVMTRELTSANLSPQAFFKRVSDETGIGLKQVEQKISEGKVSRDILLGAYYETLQDKTGKLLGGADEAMSKTFLVQKKKLGDIIPNLFEDLEKSGGLKGLTVAMMKISAAFDPDSDSGQRIIKGLTRIIDKVAELMLKVDVEKFATGVISFLERLPELLEKSVAAMERFVKVASYFVPSLPVDPMSDNGKAAASALRKDKDEHPTAAGVTGWIMDKLAGPRKFPQPPVPAAPVMNYGAALPPDMSPPMLMGPRPPLLLEPAAPASPPPMVPASSSEGAAAAAGTHAAIAAPRGGNTFAANVTVHIDSASGDADAQHEMAREVGESVRRHSESLFDRMAAEGGAA